LISGILHEVSIYSVFNSQRQKNLFSMLLNFQELRDSKKSKVKEHASKDLRWIRRTKGERQEANKMQMGHVVGQYPSRSMRGICPSIVRFTSNFRVVMCFDLKTPMYIPLGILFRDGQTRRSKTSK
jgi:hypothetical protein